MKSVNIMLLEEPRDPDGQDDEALKLIEDAAKANGTPHRIVKTNADLGPRLTELLAELEDGEVVETIDIVGHGAPGSLHVGGTAHPAGLLTSANILLSTVLEADVDRQADLRSFFKQLVELAPERRGEDFRLRLLGCRVGLDLGLTDRLHPVAVRDGAVLIHHLASFLDIPVEAPLGYIYGIDFSTGSFDPSARRLRRCTVDATTSEVRFEPSGFFWTALNEDEGSATGSLGQPLVPWKSWLEPPGGAALDGPLGRHGPLAPAALGRLASYFPADSRRLPGAPLLAIAATLRQGDVRVSIAEGGRDLLVQRGDDLRRVRGDDQARDAALELVRWYHAGELDGRATGLPDPFTTSG